MEWFAATFPGAPAEESIDGVRIVRGGRQWTVHWRAYRRYRNRLAPEFDIVVDQINTIPFFTPLWANIRSVAFIHQLAREVWWYESRFPVSLIGYLMEPLYLRLYRRVPTITVSESTKRDLERLGFRSRITVIPEGLEAMTDIDPARPSRSSILFVGRLAPSKRVADTIRAFAIAKSRIEPATLRLIGDGQPPYVQELKDLCNQLGVEDAVQFLGRVSVIEKHREMASAHVLVLTSVREGWGLVVTEANYFGTPAIGYDVPGLRDSIRNEETGLLVKSAPEQLASAMVRLLTDDVLWNRLSNEARAWSHSFSYDRMAELFADELARASKRTSGDR